MHKHQTQKLYGSYLRNKTGTDEWWFSGQWVTVIAMHVWEHKFKCHPPILKKKKRCLAIFAPNPNSEGSSMEIWGSLPGHHMHSKFRRIKWQSKCPSPLLASSHHVHRHVHTSPPTQRNTHTRKRKFQYWFVSHKVNLGHGIQLHCFKISGEFLF